MNEFIKFITATLIRYCSCFFYFFSLKKRIIFESFSGKQISCNPYYIYIYLKNKFPSYKYIWCYNGNNIDCIKSCKRNSFTYYYYLLTSSVYITNDSIPQYVRFRKSQLIINTWHGGGAYKKVGLALSNKLSWYTRLNLCRAEKNLTYLVSTSEVFTNEIATSFFVDKNKVLPIGMPRNDVFFNQELINANNKKIRDIFSIDKKALIVLYAPTYRSDGSTVDLDFSLICDALREKYRNTKKIYILIRAHHLMVMDKRKFTDSCIDVSSYPNMQELLCAADILISDYSSCIWDYSFTYRPCFLFVPDLLNYQNDRDFYRPIHSWGFPIAKSNEQLYDQIIKFDENKYINNITHHHNDLKSYEDGHATEKIVKIIVNQLEK